MSIAYLKTLYSGAPTQITKELRISGGLISSDIEGNFYQTMVLYDGTGGIELRVAIDQIFRRFTLNSHVTVRCTGLWLGSYGGTLQLGAGPYQTFETQPLNEEQIAEHITYDSRSYGEIAAQVRTIAGLTAADISTLVAFENVRFVESDTWTEEGIDTNRHLIDNQNNMLIVRTSSHATFGAWELPVGTGRIEGILSRFNSDYQLVVVDGKALILDRTDNP